jgi:hypothetical protein
MPPFATITSGGIKMETLNIGNISLTWLDGGVTHMDGGAMFGVVPNIFRPFFLIRIGSVLNSIWFLSFTGYFLDHKGFGTTPNIAPQTA